MASAYVSGGIERTVSFLSKSLLEKEEFKIKIFSIFGSEAPPLYDYGRDCEIINLFEEERFDLRRNFFNVKKVVEKSLLENDIDILIVEGSGLTPFIYSYIKSNKVIVRDHTGFLNSKKFGLSWFGRKIAMNYSNALVVLTETDLKEYKKNSKKELNIKCIYNPVTGEFEKTNYDYNSKKIMACGRLSYEKGFDLLLKSVKDTFKKYPEWNLEIIGEGPEESHLRSMIDEFDLQKHVSLKGQVHNIYQIYSNYSFLVVPSRFEGFGMVIIEALKTGIPVISFNAPNGPKEIIVDLKNGLLVEEKNINKMTEAIEKLILSQKLRIELASNSEYQLFRFEKEKIVDQWTVLLKML